jgi:hypothetical protein
VEIEYNLPRMTPLKQAVHDLKRAQFFSVGNGGITWLVHREGTSGRADGLGDA